MRLTSEQRPRGGKGARTGLSGRRGFPAERRQRSVGCGPGPPEEWHGGGEQRVLSEERRGEEGRGGIVHMVRGGRGADQGKL